MSSTNDINSNTVTKKCGEIIITMKKNAKNVYSFNCWFCDTIYIQMKKFTLHLEREHVTELKDTTYWSKELLNNNVDSDSIRTEIENDPNSILVTEIKIETCPPDDDENETGEDNQVVNNRVNQKKEHSPSSLDPLETFGSIADETCQANSKNNEEFITLKVDNKQFVNVNEYPTEEIEIFNFSDEDQAEEASDFSCEENTSDSDYKVEDNIAQRLTKEFDPDKKSKDKELILALIEAYHRNPQLWNTSLADRCNFKQKENLLQTITDDLNEKFQLKLKLYTIKKKLNFICKQYEKEVEKQTNQMKKSMKIDNSALWFYENMSFLKSTIENKIKLKRKKPNQRVKPLNDNQMSDLIDIYKKYNNLWDVNHLAYTIKDKRQETMQSMVEDIEKKMNLVLDVYKLEKNLHYLHKAFAKDKHKRLECEAKQLVFQASCSYFNKCEFLEKHQGPFRCSNCNEIIETYNEYQIHKSQHDGSIPFKCQECGMGFKKITNYTIHAKRHLRVFKFHCEICGKGYPFNAELDLHMRSHTGAQPYLCSICGEGFRTAISYDNHIRRHEKRFKYFCHICKKGFNHMTRLNDHVKAHLNVRDIICKVCGKGFTSRKYLNHHKRIHEGKNYSCNICGKSFAQDAGLRAHKKYHGTPIGASSIKKEQNKYNMS